MGRSGLEIGVFGGTFDPIHIGHLRAVEEVREALGLKKVLFVLSARPPHKGGLAHAPAEDRWHMLLKALEGNPYFEASDVELNREGFSYTVDTIRELLLVYGKRLCFIIGEDAFRAIKTWKEWDVLLGLCPFVVMKRTDEDLQGFLKELGFEPNGPSLYLSQKGVPLFLIPVTSIKVSATQIRELVKTGKSIKYLVPAPVEEHILKRGLYRSP